jgi:hypothetical protein
MARRIAAMEILVAALTKMRAAMDTVMMGMSAHRTPAWAIYVSTLLYQDAVSLILTAMKAKSAILILDALTAK